MKNHIFRTALIASLFGVASMSMAQKNGQILKGRVVDTEGNPIPGAIVNVAEQSRIAITDQDGNFSLKGVKLADEINVSSVGYQNATGEAVLDGTFTVIMEDAIGAKDVLEPVPFGKKKALLTTDATSSVSGETLQKFPITILQNAFTSTLNGMETYEWSAEPGWSETQMYIRGIRTTNSSARSPLIIVDDVERDLSFLDAFPIEKITVLKDAAATAIYGMRGANGVIMVTTKRGVAGKTKIDITQEVGWQKLSDKMENQNSYNQALTRNRVRYLSGQAPMYSDEQIAKYKLVSEGHKDQLSEIDQWKYFDTNWFSELYRENAPQTKTNFQISGGNNRARYYVSFSWLRQGGMWNDKYTGYNKDYDTQALLNRYNLRSNIDIDINQYLNVQVDLGGRIDNINQPTTSVFNLTTFGAVEGTPFEPTICPNGEIYSSSTANNPWRLLAAGGQEKNRRRNLYSTVTLNANLDKVVKGLKAYGLVSFDSFETFESTQTNDVDTYSYDFNNPDVTAIDQFTYTRTTTGKPLSDPSANQREWYYHINMNAGLGYENTIADNHYIQAKAFVRAYRSEVTGSNSADRNLSINGTATYAYDNRYILSGNYSRMGSDNFDPDERWGNFYGVSAGWNIAEESFIKDKVNFLDLLKLRASYGKAGQSATGVGRYPYQSTYASGTGYAFGYNASYVGGFLESTAGNKNNKWEVSEMVNLGADFNLWNGKLYGEFDWFKENRSGILVTRSTIPSIVGVNVSQDSYGKVKTHGWEAKLGHSNKIGKDFKYNTEFNVTFNTNEIVDIDETEPNVEWQRKAGHRIYDNTSVVNLYEVPFNGTVGGWNIYKFEQWASDPNLISTSQADAIANPQKYPYNANGTQTLGTAVFKDVNGDRQIDANDMVPDTYTIIPEYVLSFKLGLEYKGFDASAILSAYLNRDVFISSASTFSGWSNMGTHLVTDTWGYYTDDPNDPRNVNAKYPRPMWGDFNSVDSNRGNNSYQNDIWIQNGNYLSLKSLEFGYSLPKKWIAKAWMTKCRVYFNAYNVANFSGLPDGMDPEKPMSYCWWYPKTRSFNFGVNIGF